MICKKKKKIQKYKVCLNYFTAYQNFIFRKYVHHRNPELNSIFCIRVVHFMPRDVIFKSPMVPDVTDCKESSDIQKVKMLDDGSNL